MDSDPQDLIKEGLHNTALEIRALNVDVFDVETKLEVADKIDKVADCEKPEDMVVLMMSTLAAIMMDTKVPALVHLTIGRVVSELNIKLIERIQTGGTV